MRCVLLKKKVFELELSSVPSQSFFSQKAIHSVDLHPTKSLKHTISIDLTHFPSTWRLGVVKGTSGSGKSSFAEKFFKGETFSQQLNPDLPVIDQFSEEFSFEERAEILNRLGLSQVPCWVKPYKALSNGQKARADAAIAISLASTKNQIVVLDEWTSVVDRTVGKIMTSCLDKFTKSKPNLRLVLVTCHDDILDWCFPDWIVDCNAQQLHIPLPDEKKNQNSIFQSTDAKELFGTALSVITI